MMTGANANRTRVGKIVAESAGGISAFMRRASLDEFRALVGGHDVHYIRNEHGEWEGLSDKDGNRALLRDYDTP
ncbi:MAG: hypothetical protein ACREBH_02780 [Candidatus Micrarchaeaceae archaeon]